ncbi:hypothetical protein, partial [Arthrobacter sp. UYCu712]|uniref:hypothetical protein n=1 Tax=Arthrobacter sp. UYCu712 TaxID=3156340 RepID=UPI003397877F
PYQDPESKQPPDPFPEWHSFVAGHALPAMDTALDTDDKFWPALLNDPIPEGLLVGTARNKAWDTPARERLEVLGSPTPDS